MSGKKTDRKFRARILLPAEMVLYGVLLILAVSGGVARGGLWEVLAQTQGNLPWLVIVGGVGSTGLAVSAAEWFFGACWERPRLLRSAGVRMWCSILAVAVWGYVINAMVTVPGAAAIISIAASAMWAIVFHLWVIFRLKRLYVILHPAFSTSRLETRLENGDGARGI